MAIVTKFPKFPLNLFIILPANFTKHIFVALAHFHCAKSFMKTFTLRLSYVFPSNEFFRRHSQKCFEKHSVKQSVMFNISNKMLFDWHYMSYIIETQTANRAKEISKQTSVVLNSNLYLCNFFFSFSYLSSALIFGLKTSILFGIV